MKKTQKFQVRGMGCAACVAAVEKHTRALKGVEVSEVNLLTNSMLVTYDTNLCNTELLIKVVEDAGFTAEAEDDGDDENPEAGMRHRKERREEIKAKDKRSGVRMRIRLVLSILFWVPLMFLAMYHMFGAIIPQRIISALDARFQGTQNAYFYAFSQFLLLLPILVLNYRYFTGGFRAVLKGRPNMDTLIAIGSTAATGYGIYATIVMYLGMRSGNAVLAEQYSHELYFETAGTILTLITVGKYLESVSKGKTKAALEKLMDLAPQKAIVVRNGKETEIPTDEVMVGDIFILKPGSRVPVDGIVTEGHSSVDESAITGESMPAEKTVGSNVVSATVNKDGVLRCEAVKVGDDTTLHKIVELVEQAGMKKAPIAGLADRVAGVFVPVVMGIAVVSMAIWLICGASFSFAMSIGIAVLVISCPCALGLATPVAIMVGTGIGAGKGILIKSGESLQAAGEVDTVVFDKTGTLTKGEPQVKEVTVWSTQYSKTEVLRLGAILEEGSEHPLAKAVIKRAEEMREKELTQIHDKAKVESFTAIPGKGIKAVYRAEAFIIGNRAMMDEHEIEISDEQEMRIRASEEKSYTPLLMAKERELVGMFSIADTLKETSKEAVAELKHHGIKTVMLTGDSKLVANRIGDEVGIEQIFSEVLPWEKEQCIRELTESGSKVAMVGDGINDAPPLVAAHVGIAIGAGTDIAIESADIVLMHSDPKDVYRAIALSRDVMRNIKQNLFWAFFYNSIGIPLAAGALYPLFGIRMNPMFGAAAMSLSSLFVVGNALRLRLKKR